MPSGVFFCPEQFVYSLLIVALGSNVLLTISIRDAILALEKNECQHSNVKSANTQIFGVLT